MQDLFRQVDSFFLNVSDMEKAIDWYSKTLGCKLLWKNDDNDFASIDLKGFPVTLVQAKKDKEFAPLDKAPFNIFVSDIEEAHKYLKDSGTEVGSIEELYNVKWFWFKDIDGNRIEACNYIKQ